MPGVRGRGSRHDVGFLASPANKQCEERRKRAGYLYSKPKVGAQYQAIVPKYVKPDESKNSITGKADVIESISYMSKAAMELQRKKEETTIQKIENWKGDRRCKEYRGKIFYHDVQTNNRLMHLNRQSSEWSLHCISK